MNYAFQSAHRIRPSLSLNFRLLAYQALYSILKGSIRPRKLGFRMPYVAFSKSPIEQTCQGTRMKRMNHPNNRFSSWSLGLLGWKWCFLICSKAFASFCCFFLYFPKFFHPGGGCQHRIEPDIAFRRPYITFIRSKLGAGLLRILYTSPVQPQHSYPDRTLSSHNPRFKF